MIDFQTGKVIRSVISSEAVTVFFLWKFKAEARPPPPPPHAFGIPNSMPSEFQSKKPPSRAGYGISWNPAPNSGQVTLLFKGVTGFYLPLELVKQCSRYTERPLQFC